jgi:hypothetical protein
MYNESCKACDMDMSNTRNHNYVGPTQRLYCAACYAKRERIRAERAMGGEVVIGWTALLIVAFGLLAMFVVHTC